MVNGSDQHDHHGIKQNTTLIHTKIIIKFRLNECLNTFKRQVIDSMCNRHEATYLGSVDFDVINDKTQKYEL